MKFNVSSQSFEAFLLLEKDKIRGGAITNIKLGLFVELLYKN